MKVTKHVPPGKFYCFSAFLLIAMQLSVFFPLSVCTAQNQEAKSEKVVALSKFENTTIDFGTVSEGTVVSRNFNFRNVGNANLLIQRVVASCGCTAASSSTEPIAPGGEGFVKVDFDSSGFSGPKTKVVRVYSNDFENPEITLTIKGVVENDVSIEPARIIFEDIIRGADLASKDFSVRIRKSSGKQLSSVSTYSKFLKIEPLGQETELPAGEGLSERRFRIAVDSSAPVGELRERALVNLLKNGQSSSMTVPVLANIKGPVSLEPAQISFGIVEGTQKLTRAVKFVNRGKNPLEIASVRSDNDAVQAEFKTIQAGKSYVIDVTVDPARVSSDLRALIEVKTSNPDEPALYLSVFGVTPPKLDLN